MIIVNPIKIAIMGSRNFDKYDILEKTVLETFDITSICAVVSGGARGADQLGELFAKNHNIDIIRFLPDWKTYGKKAGMIRNNYIIESSDFVFAFWDGKSRGTLDSISKCKKYNKENRIILYERILNI